MNNLVDFTWPIRCLDFFRDLTEKEAEAAMDEFSQSDIVSIRNKSAFLMSILRQGVPQQNINPFCLLSASPPSN